MLHKTFKKKTTLFLSIFILFVFVMTMLAMSPQVANAQSQTDVYADAYAVKSLIQSKNIENNINLSSNEAAVSKIKSSCPAAWGFNSKSLKLSSDSILPENAGDKTFLWSVQNGTGSAAIEKNGLLTGTKPGTATINVAANDGSGTYDPVKTSVLPSYTVSSYTVSVDITGLTGISKAVWIDGKEYSGDDLDVSSKNYTVTLSNANAKTLVIYSYNSLSQKDPHKVYPTNMYVWTLSYENGKYKATRQKSLDNILQYAGCSIRVTGKKGIRMITSIKSSTKKSLTSKSGFAGYTLEEYGTAVAWENDLSAEKPLVLGSSYTKSNYAYKKGVADPIFSNKNGVTQYTNVLVGFSNAQCIPDLAQRPYIKLRSTSGKDSIILYGAPVYRSIGYIAEQNSNSFKKGTAAYNYVHGIINYVNNQTDKNDEYSEFPIAENNLLDGKVIILDTGHGTGSGGAYANYVESKYNLKHAKLIKQALENCGAKVIMTRETAADVDNYARVSMANKYALEVLKEHYSAQPDPNEEKLAELDRLINLMQNIIYNTKLADTYYLSPYAEANGRAVHPDLKKIFEYQKDPILADIIYISVHSNAPGGNNNTSISGTVTYYMSNSMNKKYYTGYQENNSKRLATVLCDRVSEAGGYARNSVIVNDFFMVREVNIPAALIEIGFHTNASDREKLMDETVQKRVANSVAYSVIDYFGK